MCQVVSDLSDYVKGTGFKKVRVDCWVHTESLLSDLENCLYQPEIKITGIFDSTHSSAIKYF